ncbi:MAG TPA: hypothetical protein VI485_29795 [Vicinamibacterales bacterium]|nr:hypothetical protein [Vicinamibacterales bacterium]
MKSGVEADFGIEERTLRVAPRQGAGQHLGYGNRRDLQPPANGIDGETTPVRAVRASTRSLIAYRNV